MQNNPIFLILFSLKRFYFTAGTHVTRFFRLCRKKKKESSFFSVFLPFLYIFYRFLHRFAPAGAAAGGSAAMSLQKPAKSANIFPCRPETR
jgi:hypothetical protein